MRARIVGTGRYLPETKLTNHDLAKIVDTSDEWIVSRTGITNRFISGATPTWEMGEKAALLALEDAGVAATDIDMIIGCTVSPDYLFPNMACIVQSRIGATGAFCYDLSAACTGFIYALDTVNQFIATGRIKTALIVCSESTSKFTDYTDRSSCILFGDGAGAVVLTGSEDAGVLTAYSVSDGNAGELLYCCGTSPTDGLGNVRRELYPNGDARYLMMNGTKVFQFAVTAMTTAVHNVLEQTGLTPDDIAVMFPHQANLRIIDAVIKREKFDSDKVIRRLDQYGNTSSSSIPICLDECSRSGRLKRGDRILLVGFGAGMTSGATIIEW